MFRKKLIIVAIVAFISFCCAAEAEQISVSWDGSGDGYSWGDPCNWNPVVVPDNNATNTFVVTIDSNRIGVDSINVYLQQDRTVNQLDCYGDIELVNWTSNWIRLTFEDANDFINHGNLEMWERYEIDGNVTNCTKATLDLENLAIQADLHNLAGGEIRVGGEVDLGNGGILKNAGRIIVIGPKGECGSDGIFDNNTTGVIRGTGAVYSDKLFRNKGAIYAYGGSLAVLSEGPLLNSGLLSNYPLSSLQIRTTEDVNNYGTIEVHAGGGMAFDCNVVNEPNATIKLLGGTLAAATITQSAEANFAGFGDITSDVLIDSNGIIRLIGPTNVVGNMEIADGATLQINDGTTLITGHTTCNNGTIHMIGGRVICQGGLTNNNCNIIWEPGTYTNMADFNLDGTVNFKDFTYFGDTWLWKADWY
jgi:hypothetical protein